MAPRRETRAQLALSIEQSAEALAISRDSFERHVMPDLRLVRIGRRIVVPVSEIERWMQSHAAIPLVADLPHPQTRRPRSGQIHAM